MLRKSAWFFGIRRLSSSVTTRIGGVLGIQLRRSRADGGRPSSVLGESVRVQPGPARVSRVQLPELLSRQRGQVQELCAVRRTGPDDRICTTRLPARSPWLLDSADAGVHDRATDAGAETGDGSHSRGAERTTSGAESATAVSSVSGAPSVRVRLAARSDVPGDLGVPSPDSPTAARGNLLGEDREEHVSWSGRSAVHARLARHATVGVASRAAYEQNRRCNASTPKRNPELD